MPDKQGDDKECSFSLIHYSFGSCLTLEQRNITILLVLLLYWTVLQWPWQTATEWAHISNFFMFLEKTWKRLFILAFSSILPSFHTSAHIILLLLMKYFYYEMLVLLLEIRNIWVILLLFSLHLFVGVLLIIVLLTATCPSSF